MISCIGARGKIAKGTSLYLDTMKAITTAMRDLCVKRLIAMTSWGTYSMYEQYHRCRLSIELPKFRTNTSGARTLFNIIIFITPEHVVIVILCKIPNAINHNHLNVVMLCYCLNILLRFDSSLTANKVLYMILKPQRNRNGFYEC